MRTRRRRGRVRWSDLSGRQRATVALAAALELGLKAAAFADMRRRPPGQIRGDRRLWTAALLVNFVGPVAYLAFGRRPPS